MENQFKDLTIFNGGLNFDDEPRNIPNGDYTYAMCCRNYNGLEQSMGAIQNVKGNTLIEFELPSGDNAVIGTATNVENKGIVYFVWNSLSKHCILQYLVEKREIEKILWEEPILGFRPSHRIYHANILDNKLFWTDGFNHPRKINILRAKEYTQGTGGYATLDKQTLDSIKYPPIVNPFVYYKNKPSNDFTPNRIAGVNWQFAYRYVYDDNEPSVFSPFSLVPAQLITNRQDDRINGLLSISIQTGHHTVKKIEIYARNNANDVFNLIETVRKFNTSGSQLVPDNGIYEFDFDNSGIYTPIAFEESFRLFDNVPLKSFGQEIIDDNVLCYANLTEGFDDVTLDVDFEVDFKYDLSPETEPQIDVNKEINLGASPAPSSVPGVDIPVGQSIVYWEWTFGNLGGDLILVISADPFNQVVFRYNVNLPNPEEALALQIRDYLISVGINAVYLVSGGVFYLYFFTTNNNITPDARLYRPGAIIGLEFLKEENIMSFKKGTKVQLGLIYYDYAGRTQGVLTDESMVVDIPWFSNSDNPTPSTDFYNSFIKYDINHKPPLFSHYYQWAIVDSDLQFEQFMLPKSELVNDGDDMTIGLNKVILENIDEFYPNGAKGYNVWTFEKGDRVRFIAELDGNISYLSSIVDREIFEFNDDTGLLKVKDLNLSDLGLDVSSTSVFIEVYRPVRVSDVSYREIGYRHYIVNPETTNNWHLPLVTPNFNVRNSSVIVNVGTLPNNGYIYGGNVFIRSRSMLDTIGGSPIPSSHNIESLTPSDTTEGFNLGYGKFVSKSLGLGERNNMTAISNGGRLFIGTQFNDILRFDGTGTKYLKESNGPINKIHLVGYVLKALQDTKLTSIYIGRVVVNASDGNTRETLSNDILGTINPYEQNIGCIDPGSVVSNVRYLYFFDRINGQFYRDAPNGPIPISEYKMSRYFDNLSKNWGNKQMFCEFNENLNELNVTTYEEVLLNAQGLYDASEQGFGFYGILLTTEEANQVPNGSMVSFGDGNTYVETTVTGRTITSSGVIILMSIPSPNPLTLEQDQPVFIDYRAKGLGETLTFYEREARWKTFMPYIPNAYGRFGRAMVSFVDGELWLHEDNEVRNTFYGVTTPSVIEFVSNINPTKIKVFDNIAQYANSVWDSPTDADIKVLPNALHPNGMISRLKSGKYVNKEGIFYAEFLRDINSPGAASHKLLNGRRLRGELLSLRLTNTQTNLVTLSKVIVYSQPSEISS